MLVGSALALGAVAVGVDLSSPTTSAEAAGTYLRPCGNVRISSSWQGHKNRNPPSSEPGTDYAVRVGTPVMAATAGTIVARKDSTSTATGRYIALQGDSGDYFRYLHLDRSALSVGRRVERGDVIAYSGASGFGSEFGYGPHVHVSMWRGTTPYRAGFANSVDFENYVGDEEDMPLSDSDIEKIARSVWNYQSAHNNLKFGDMSRVTYNAVRYGESGVRTHGDLTADLLSRLGAIENKLNSL